jgi:hypothetical protein
MEKLLNYLNSIQQLSEPLQIHLKNLLKEKRISKYELVLKSGNISRQIFFIEKGILRGYYMKKEEEISNWFMMEEDFAISVSSFFSQSPAFESIQPLEECVVFYLTYEELQHTYLKFPEFNFIGRVITEKYYVLCENRIRQMRMLKARKRHDYLFKNHADLVRRVPAKFLATYLGVTKVTFSRNRFKK